MRQGQGAYVRSGGPPAHPSEIALTSISTEPVAKQRAAELLRPGNPWAEDFRRRHPDGRMGFDPTWQRATAPCFLEQAASARGQGSRSLT